MKKRTAWNSTLRPRSAKAEAAAKNGAKPRPRSTIKRPSLDDLKKKGLVVKASTLNNVGKSDRSVAMDAADTSFSTYVRLMAANEDGFLNCFLCGERLHWKEAVAMHCEPRICMPTRYDRVNVQAGCAICNGMPNGDRKHFHAELDQRFGAGTAEANVIKSKTTEKFTAVFLRMLCQRYDQRIEKMRKSEPGKFERP